MDLIRIFIDTAFAKISDRYFNNREMNSGHELDDFMISQVMFVDECRCHHPELSDDQMRMIYQLYLDQWTDDPNKNIFQVLFNYSNDLLRIYDGVPMVKFSNLFRWRESSQVIGEDLMVCAYLAYNLRNIDDEDLSYALSDDVPANRSNIIDFASWPTVLHNDNPQLKHIFENRGLCELHSHLYASVDNFGLSWICLMNKIYGRDEKFKKLAEIQDESNMKHLSEKIKKKVIRAYQLRLGIWNYLQNHDITSINISEIVDEDMLDKSTASARGNSGFYDYIACRKDSPLEVFTGERRFIFESLREILKNGDPQLIRSFYEYILLKNFFRSFLVQINNNRGFGNFQRFQDLKTKFVTNKYSSIIPEIAAYESYHFNYGKLFETRIVPKNHDEINKIISRVHNVLKSGCKDEPIEIEKSLNKINNRFDLSILFHFIKEPDGKNENGEIRDFDLRSKVAGDSELLRNLLNSDGEVAKALKGIDAADSEIYCRPEVFGQAFRFLKHFGYHATFHAGEDYYDIADGLRAISEAILYLGLESRDRIGHALALGVNADKFYNERHNVIALPKQWMLDNVSWLYYKTKKFNIVKDPQTELFLENAFRDLVREIGYLDFIKGIDIRDYYQSMLLRSDNQVLYNDGEGTCNALSSSDWNYYAGLNLPEIKDIRKYNKTAVDIFQLYLRNSNIKRNGSKVKSYNLPKGYCEMIKNLQNAMIKEISKRRIGIECCPSSNVKIGYLERFESHPIFRFMPIRHFDTKYPLAVTVNTDDLGMFATSLPNEFSLLALALLKMKDEDGNAKYSSQEVYDWIDRVVQNGHIYRF